MKIKLSALFITIPLCTSAQPAPTQASVATTKRGTNHVTITVTGGGAANERCDP